MHAGGKIVSGSVEHVTKQSDFNEWLCENSPRLQA